MCVCVRKRESRDSCDIREILELKKENERGWTGMDVGARGREGKETYIITISHQVYCKTRNVPRLVIVYVYTL